MKKTLIFGKNGQVGWECHRALSTLGPVLAVDSPEVNLSNTDEVVQLVRSFRPDVIINAAAYTAVDKAEVEYDFAHRINAIAPAVMAEEARKCNAAFLTFSTDYVYDGTKQSPYIETDPERPVNAYGRSKLAGDELVSAVGGAYIILRTSWVYGARGKNFLNTIIRLASERSELRIVNDQTGCPTWCRLLAELCSQILVTCQRNNNDAYPALKERAGVYHASGGGETNWYEFASAIVNGCSTLRESGLQLKPITSAEYQTPARRPMYGVLSTQKLRDTFGICLPHWQVSLNHVLDEVGEKSRQELHALRVAVER